MNNLEPSSVTSLDYVRMCAEVSGWIRDAADRDERERLTKLAEHYRHLAEESIAKERSALLGNLLPDLRQYLEHQDVPLPDRSYSSSELEQVRALSALTPIAQLDVLSPKELHDLADLMEGWAQTPHLHTVRAARFFGLADGLRNIAEAVGLDWQPSSSAGASLSSEFVRWMYDPES